MSTTTDTTTDRPTDVDMSPADQTGGGRWCEVCGNELDADQPTGVSGHYVHQGDCALTWIEQDRVAAAARALAEHEPVKLDGDRLTDEWVAWAHQRRDESWHDTVDVWPELNGRWLGRHGRWVCVVDPPDLTRVDGTDFDIPPLSVWFAVCDPPSDYPFRSQQPQMARIVTPDGPVWLRPREYTPVERVGSLAQIDGVEAHLLRGTPIVDTDQHWYLRARGIDSTTAAVLLLDDIAQQDFVWLTVDPDLDGRDVP